jgi:hypothetical protein
VPQATWCTVPALWWPGSGVPAQLPGDVAGRLRAEHALEQAPRLGGIARVRPYTVEAAERELLRDVGVLGPERLVRVRDHELVPQTLEVVETEPVAVALDRDALALQPLRPEVERLG